METNWDPKSLNNSRNPWEEDGQLKWVMRIRKPLNKYKFGKHNQNLKNQKITKRKYMRTYRRMDFTWGYEELKEIKEKIEVLQNIKKIKIKTS